jgi:hypothetical protein
MSVGRYLRKSSISAIVVVAAACSLTSGGAESPLDETPQNIVSPELSLDVTAELDPELRWINMQAGALSAVPAV